MRSNLEKIQLNLNSLPSENESFEHERHDEDNHFYPLATKETLISAGETTNLTSVPLLKLPISTFDSPSLNNNIPDVSNLVDLLLWRSAHQPEQKAYTFLEDGENESASLTYGELDLRAKVIAAQLQSLKMSGERALLLYNPGLEFIMAFFGCLYANVIPVPVYPPRRNQNLSRLQDIVSDAGAKLALTSSSILGNIEKQFAEIPDLASVCWLTSDAKSGLLGFNSQEDDPNCQSRKVNFPDGFPDKITNFSEDKWHKPKLDGNSLAFLQYTSGSTSKPKGVMVSHQNLLVNSADLDRGWEHDEHSVIVTWLPTFHDLGLIYGVMQPLYRGIPCYMMAPVAFLQSPIRWLKAITRYGGTHSGAPNFAYQLCCEKIKDEQKPDLDLSSWKMALNGAEPVRADVLKKFIEEFDDSKCGKDRGFKPTAFCPGYGLAEATLKVTAVRSKDDYQLLKVKSSALRNNQVVLVNDGDEDSQILVGSGYTEIDTEIKIVNPDTLIECSIDQVCEIWVAGKTVTQGYWQNSAKTKETFHAHIADTKEGPFLRTGDLGFIKNKELFVTGRFKDLIVIRGKNHYPQDIEQTVENSHEAIIFNHSAAFTLEIKEEDKLIIVAEVERRYRIRRQKSKEIIKGEEKRKTGDRRQNQEPVEQFFAPDLQNKPVFEEIISNIRQNVARNHGLQVHQIVLIRFGTIPRTSSGKIQRYACQNAFLEGTLNIIYDSERRT